MSFMWYERYIWTCNKCGKQHMTLKRRTSLMDSKEIDSETCNAVDPFKYVYVNESYHQFECPNGVVFIWEEIPA